MKTVIHQYSYNTNKPEDAAAWRELCDARKAAGVKPFAAISTEEKCPLDGEVDLDTARVFHNQWNTASTDGSLGWRVFDFYQRICPNRAYKSGHWLEITEDMRAIRRNTWACGYCGHQRLGPHMQFCPKCIGSQYLQLSQLYLTRMLPVASTMDRRSLTISELALLKPKYIDAQLKRRTVDDTSELRLAERACTETIERAQNKLAGIRWLIENGIRTDNAIFYEHTGRWCFGWRKQLGDEERAALVESLDSFPFPFDMRLAGGENVSIR